MKRSAKPRHRSAAVVLALLPMLPAAAIPEEQGAQAERLQWLLTQHDVRHAIHAPHASSGDCLRGETERGR